MINLLLKKEMTTAQVNWVFYLKNDSEYSFACNLNLVGSSRPYRVREFFLKGGECKLVFSVPVHFIDDHPKVEYEVYRYSTMGREGKHSGEVKIKARDFARKMVYVGDIASDCLKYPIWKESPAQKTKPALRFMEKEESSDPNYRKVEIYDTEEMLEFERTLDLHIEKLVGDPSKINPKSAFLIQMNAYKTFLDKALRLGVDRVYVIHGVGSGKLRKGVIEYAEGLDAVAEVKNEYDGRFGFGATEIIFH